MSCERPEIASVPSLFHAVSKHRRIVWSELFAINGRYSWAGENRSVSTRSVRVQEGANETNGRYIESIAVEMVSPPRVLGNASKELELYEKEELEVS